jgi:uncharacterized protein (TIGR02284 family)
MEPVVLPKEDARSVVLALNTLIEVCLDSTRGYEHAAKDADDDDFRILLSYYAKQRAGFVNDLQQAVRGLGDYPQEYGSWGGAIHRGWLDTEAKMIRRPDHMIASECTRGEKIAKRRYMRALEETMPMPLRQLVERQYQGVLAGLEEMERLRDIIS